ncbi:hypothetical protein GCM10007352_32020 [Mucilaginibacter phyllosphaerae]|nr:hypothetical protein GCM10007352_32020 [Mucilaginibacter phyllosphaerae]
MLLSIFTLIQTSNKRVVSVYTIDANNASYQQQIKLLNEDKAGLTERDVIIKTYIYSDQTADKFKESRIKGYFTITLTGKDGGEKYRSTQPVTLQKLYSTIDAMPMRKDEVKQ